MRVKRKRAGNAPKELPTFCKGLLLVWFAIWIQMSLCHRPSIEKYWQSEYGDPFVKGTQIPRDTWNDVNVLLFHLSDDMLEYMENRLNANFRRFWRPARRVSLDESMRRFKGKWKGKVYIKNKPTKWGIKYYMVVDELDFCIWFSLYKGAAHEDPAITQKTRHLVNKALDTLPKDMGAYAIYVDNYYGSLDLAQDTIVRGFDFTFNCKSNRPAWLFTNGVHTTMSQESPSAPKMSCWIHKEHGYAAVSYSDKRMVNFITTIATTETTTVQQRQNKQENKTDRCIPKVAQDYTQGGMGHVDTFDAALSRFSDHRNISWRRCHFMSMLKMAVVNAWVMYCALLEKRGEGKTAKKLTLCEFMEMLKWEMVKGWNADRASAQEEKKKRRTKILTEQQRERRKHRKKEAEDKAKAEGEPLQTHFRINRESLLQAHLAQLAAKEVPTTNL